jgi:hypothetical protein
VDVHDSGGLNTRRNYMFREAFVAVENASPPSPPSVPGELCVGGRVWIRGYDYNASAGAAVLVLGGGNNSGANLYNDSQIEFFSQRCISGSSGGSTLRYSRYLTINPAQASSVTPLVDKTVAYVSGPNTIYEVTGSYPAAAARQTRLAANGFSINVNGDPVPLDGLSDSFLGAQFQGGLIITVPTDGAEMPQVADGSAGNGKLYYSTTANKLAFKDLSAAVHYLY